MSAEYASILGPKIIIMSNGDKQENVVILYLFKAITGT